MIKLIAIRIPRTINPIAYAGIASKEEFGLVAFNGVVVEVGLVVVVVDVLLVDPLNPGTKDFPFPDATRSDMAVEFPVHIDPNGVH